MSLLSGLLPFGGGGGGTSMSSGGIGNSASSSASADNDGRVVGGQSSTNTSTLITGSSNVLTDSGAIAGSLQLAMAGIEGALQVAQAAQASNGGLIDGALKNSGDQQAAFTSAVEKSKPSDVRSLIITGMVVVAVVAGAVLLKKG